jgi:hypothetical protein
MTQSQFSRKSKPKVVKSQANLMKRKPSKAGKSLRKGISSKKSNRSSSKNRISSKRSIRSPSKSRKTKGKKPKNVKTNQSKAQKPEEPPKFGPLAMDDGDDPITNHNPMEINHPDAEPVIASKPCNTLWNKPDLEKDDPMLRVPRHRGGFRDDMSMTNTSFNSQRSVPGNHKQSLEKKA